MADLTYSTCVPITQPVTIVPETEGLPPKPPAIIAGAILFENGNRILLENSTGVLLLEG